MTWSWRVGRIAGIDVYVHPTFILLLSQDNIGEFLMIQSALQRQTA
jgi:hypothetical protein